VQAGAVDLSLPAFGRAAGINIVTLPFQGGAEATTALAGGHLMICDDPEFKTTSRSPEEAFSCFRTNFAAICVPANG
jgi:hypothetical protein